MRGRAFEPPSRTGNRLLAAMPAEERRTVWPYLERVTLEPRKTLVKPRAQIRHIYFPESGAVSLVNRLTNGAIMEVGLIGREGAVGTLALLGTRPVSSEAIVQFPGSALRLPTEVLRANAAWCPGLRDYMMRFTQALFAQVAQSATCNGRHKLQERMARWLLMAHDRMDGDALPVSHEFLATMLGVRRPGVTNAVGALRTAGLIDSTHGRITICDRDGLEQAACECYRAVRDEYERLLPRAR